MIPRCCSTGEFLFYKYLSCIAYIPANTKAMKHISRTLLHICMLVMLLTLHTQAQMVTGLNRDSLRRVLHTLPADTNKVMAFITLGQQYENNIPDSALYYYEQARYLSVQLHYPAGFVRYVNNYTAVLNMQGRYNESLKLDLQAVDTCRRYGLQEQLVKVLINTGVVYQYKEDYGRAADYYMKSLPLLESSGDLAMLSAMYGNLCGMYRNLHQLDKAYQYARKALQYGEQSGNEYAVGTACSNLANSLQDLDSTAAAVHYAQRAYNTGIQLDDIVMQEAALMSLGNSYKRTRNYDKYLAAFRSALPLARVLDDVNGQSIAMQGITEGLFWKKQYQQAAISADTALAYAKVHDQKEVTRGLLLMMSDIQIALGNQLLSRQYRYLYDSARDALMNDNLQKNIQELETKYEVEKKQHQLLEKDQQALRQRLWLIAAGAGILILCLLLLLTYRHYRQKQQVLQAGQENVRLKALLEGQLQERQRISQEMHDDMGSGLTAMLFLSRSIREPETAAVKIQRTAADLIRKMNEIIWTMNPEQNTLDSLIAYIRVNTAEALENAGLAYHFHIAENIPAINIPQEMRRNLYLASKEAVHNIIKHAGATEAVIGIFIINNELRITIQDNGHGFENPATMPFGNGLKNMDRRMKQIGGYLLVVNDEGTVVNLAAPLAL